MEPIKISSSPSGGGVEFDGIDSFEEQLGTPLRSTEEQLSICQTEVHEMREQHARLEEQIRVLQQARLQSLETARWMPVENSTIRINFQQLHREIDVWSKRYSLEPGKGIKHISSDNKRSLIDALSKVAEDSSNFAKSLERGELSRGVLSLHLAALLSLEVHRNIKNPFCFFGEEICLLQTGHEPNGSDQTRKQNLSLFLCNMYENMIKVDEVEAHIWRSQFLRLLNPPPSDMTKGSTEMRKDVSLRVEHANHSTSRRFTTSPVRHLIRPMNSADKQICLKELESIYNQAARLHSQLWTQRTDFGLFGLEQLRSRGFSVQSPQLEAHRLHKLDDPQDQRLDGQKIKVVVHQGVHAYGTHDAEDYRSQRTWSKATVWMGA